MTNFEKIKQMSVEDMAEMLLDASEKHFTYCNHCSYQSFMHRIVHLATFEQIAYMQSKNGLKVR